MRGLIQLSLWDKSLCLWRPFFKVFHSVLRACSTVHSFHFFSSVRAQADLLHILTISTPHTASFNMHFTALLSLLPLLVIPVIAIPLAEPDADAYAYAFAEPEAAQSLSGEIDSALNSFESSLQLIQSLQGIDGCDVAKCIQDMAPAITDCSAAQEQSFSNPQQDVACLGEVVSAAEGFVSFIKA